MHLLVTHKSILRAHLCVALGLPPSSFRAFDVNNGGICTFRWLPSACSCCTQQASGPQGHGVVHALRWSLPVKQMP